MISGLGVSPDSKLEALGLRKQARVMRKDVEAELAKLKQEEAKLSKLALEMETTKAKIAAMKKANVWTEPFPSDAAPRSNGSNVGKTRRSVCVRYAYT